MCPRTAHQFGARRAEFGRRVRELRQARGLTQEALAQSAGMERKTIVRIERGLHSPVLDRVFLLADALGVAPAELFAPADQNDKDEPGAPVIPPPEP